MATNPHLLHYRYLPSTQAGANITLVFLHGIAGSQASWLQPFNTLATHAHLLFIDCLGFGQSPRPHLPYTVDNHVQALQNTLTHWQSEQKLQPQHIILVGHSMGALLCAHWAQSLLKTNPSQAHAHTPENTPNTTNITHKTNTAKTAIELTGLVLVSLPLFEDEQDAVSRIGSTSLFNRWMALETPIARATCWLMCRLRPWLTPLMPHLLPELPPEVARDSLQHSWTSYSQTLQQVIIKSRGRKLLEQLVHTDKPVLIIHGDHDTLADAQRMRQFISNHPAHIECLMLDGAHDIVFTHSQQMAQAIDRFVTHIAGC